jgi:hypothetical protein
MGNVHEIPVFFDTLTNSTFDVKDSKSMVVKSTGYEKL